MKRLGHTQIVLNSSLRRFAKCSSALARQSFLVHAPSAWVWDSSQEINAKEAGEGEAASADCGRTPLGGRSRRPVPNLGLVAAILGMQQYNSQITDKNLNEPCLWSSDLLQQVTRSYGRSQFPF